MASARAVLAMAVIVLLLAPCSLAQEAFRDLIQKLPPSTNAVVILNVDKMKVSPMGVKEGFAENLEQAFKAGLSRIPPRATRFITAAELDLEFMTPVYEVAVFEINGPPSFERIVQEYGGTMDTLDGRKAVHLTTDAYAVQLGPQTVGVMRPANRQSALRWLRDTRPGKEVELSSYIQKAAGYSDDAGTDIIMAIDLAGAFSWERIGKYLKGKESFLKESGVDLKDATSMLQSVAGLRVGLRIGEQPSGRLVVDFGQTMDFSPDFAKALLLEVFADAGMMISDLNEWKCDVRGTEISLSGVLSRDGLRRLGSLVDSPAPAHATGEAGKTPPSPSEAKASMAENSLEYFKSINAMFDDLKRDWRNLKALSAGAIYFDRYARRIEQLPMLNVDNDMLDYGQYVAQQLRGASGAVRTMGIRGGARQSQISGYDAAPSAVRYGYGGRWGGYGGYRAGWGGWGVQTYYNPQDVVRQTEDKRRQIRADEKAKMATNVYTIRDNLIAATNEVRRAMTQKYQVQF